MKLRYKVITITSMLIAVVAIGTAAFYAQSAHGLAKEYRAQSEELDAVKVARARQYGILMRLPNNDAWKKATDAVNKLTDSEALNQFAKIGEQEDKAQ